MLSMLAIKQQLCRLLSFIPPGSRVVCVDEPLHRNIGDHLIHLGMERFFREHGMRVAARVHRYNYSRRWLGRALSAQTILVCSGGGHLGNLYPWHQALRAQLMVDFPHHRIVILPQSLYFSRPESRHPFVSQFNRHPDCHVFLRDRDSLAQAEQIKLHRIYLAPDMAHALYPLDTQGHTPVHGFYPAVERRYLLRRDREALSYSKACNGSEFMPGKGFWDWPDLVRVEDTLVLAAIASSSWIARGVGPCPYADDALDWIRARLVQRGLALFSTCEEVVTSRLHGALLGLLLNKRVTLLPSLTGKSTSYYHTWLKKLPNCVYLA